MPFDSKDFVAAPVRHPEEIAILDKMAELLATPERWLKGALACGDRVCLAGAGRKVLTGSPWKSPERTSVSLGVSNALRYAAGGFIGSFNDDPHTTHADILALIARAPQSFE